MKFPSNRKIALGTVQFGLPYGIANESGQVSFNEASRIIRLASASRINTLDTAIAYGDSEKTLGKIGVTKHQIISKLPPLPEQCDDIEAWVESQVADSLTRLGVNRLHALLLHRPDQLLGSHGKRLVAALESIKSSGAVDKIGISVYSPDELESLFERWNFDIIQAPLSILDQRLVVSGWAKKLKNMGVEVHSRSTFLQGLLLMHDRPDKFNRWKETWFEWDRWLMEVGITPLEACLRYVLSINEIDKVVVGVDSEIQLHDILASTNGQLPSQPKWPSPIDLELISPSCWDSI